MALLRLRCTTHGGHMDDDWLVLTADLLVLLISVFVIVAAGMGVL